MISILLPSRTEPRIIEMLEEIDKQFPNAQTIVANDRYQMGKGWAMREALSQAEFDVICFLDGDLDIHPRMIWRLLPFIEDYDIVVGKKAITGLWSRRILTALSRIYIWMLFGLNVDTQTGIKMFRRQALSSWKSDSFAFDIEVLTKARAAGMTMVEVPIEANIRKRMKAGSVWKCLIESIKIWRSLWE